MTKEENVLRKFRKGWRELRSKFLDDKINEAEYRENAISLIDKNGNMYSEKIKTFLLNEYGRENDKIGDRILNEEITYDEYLNLSRKLFLDYALIFPRTQPIDRYRFPIGSSSSKN